MATWRSLSACAPLLLQVHLVINLLSYAIVERSAALSDIRSGQADESGEQLWIYQHDPVKIGHVQNIELEPGRTYEMITMALNPPVFIIPNFLTDEECEQIKALARETGLELSKTRRKKTVDIPPSLESNETFAQFDADADGILSLTEMQEFMVSWYNITLSKNELQFLLTQASVDLDSDQFIDEEEFSIIPRVEGFVKRIAEGLRRRPMPMVLRKKLRKGIDRKSATVRLEHDLYDPERKLRNRVAALTKVHPDIVHSSEKLHVVHYNSTGHYHAHTDSHKIDHLPGSVCEHADHLYPNQSNGEPPNTRICRFMTILYYLNEPEGGGQTAFPMADNGTYTQEGIIYEYRHKDRDVFDLTNHCTDSNLVVEAKKGLAVMWYNHHVENGWVGDLNPFSLHGGCEVISGEKWIANNWINVDQNYDMQKAYIADRIRQQQKPTKDDAITQPMNITKKNDGICKLSSEWNYSASMVLRDEL